MGFLKAYDLAVIDQLSIPISRTAGVVWFGAFLLFLASAITYLFGIDWWWMIVAVGIVVSQTLIITYWGDAKYGTIANVIILAGCILGYGHWSFNAMVDREVKQFWDSIPAKQTKVHDKVIYDLPPIVSRWIDQTNIADQQFVQAIQLKQKGKMKTTPDGGWMSVQAEQFIKTANPSFLWVAEAEMAPYIHLAGRDKYKDGKGHMLIKLLSLFPVVNAEGAEMNQGTLVRYLAEMVWYPSAVTEEYLRWEQLDSSSARATIKYGGITTSGIFEFNKDGLPVRFKAERYYTRQERATLERWVINIDPSSYQLLDGIMIPTQASVTWQLDEGAFKWYILEITEATYYLSNH
ncbi:DUF6920 family protein [Fodinibius saliphilus]|uniref:DUF6920 family protein n=1 Tax=Fodinibius saliphilus TaxID=1920650 RepID=UPI00110836BE|nr:DUF6544 family protein [Fodinibius saliphilus]